jgi:hypothetical protein
MCPPIYSRLTCLCSRNYVLNGQPASREVYESRSNKTFVAYTFVDGVMTEFEDLGRMPDDASFQGR